MKIEIISGSPRQESTTFRLVLFLKKYLQEKTNHHTDIIDVRNWELSVMQQEVYTSVENTPDALKPLSERMFAADAFIMATPEYNGSYTPALKNLFDHYPKQSHKAFGIVTASPGAMGGMRASQQMQLLINALFGIASPHMLITPYADKKFDASGNLLDNMFLRNIEIFIKEFLWLAESLVREGIKDVVPQRH